jgi:predicted dehydrogenase
MNALVVGHGRMGGFHRKALADLGYDVTTVDPAMGVADYRTVPERRFDVVCVATPIEHLAETAAGFAGHDGHLLIEKPMAVNSKEAFELIGLFHGQHRRIAVGYVERFNPQVRRLRRALRDREPAARARFVRWNTRPTDSPRLDLMTHDVDLAEFLGLTHVAEYDTRASAPEMRRHITVERFDRVKAPLHVSLLDHDTSPLHAQWHSFLGGGWGDTPVATPTDAAWALSILEAPVAVAMAA